MTIRLREITVSNAASVQALRTRPDQEQFVSSVVESLAEAAEVPQANPWFRAVYADDQPIGFVMLAWNVDPQPPGIGSPSAFYDALGFVPTGAVDESGEVLARLPL